MLILHPFYTYAHSYTIVQVRDTYWVMQSTDTVHCTGCPQEETVDVDTALIKAHGKLWLSVLSHQLQPTASTPLQAP